MTWWIPVLAGVAYEYIRWTASHLDSPVVRWLVQPYFAQLEHRHQRVQGEVHSLQQAISQLILAVDRPFECFVIGDKS